MKINLFLVTLCLCVFTASGQAQPEESIISLDQMLRSPMGQQMMKDELKQEIYYYWGGASAFVPLLLNDPKICTAWGVSGEFQQHIFSAWFGPSPSSEPTHPEMQKLIKELETLESRGVLFSPDIDAKIQKDIASLNDKLLSLSINVIREEMDKALPPELKQKVQETLLASMPEVPIISIYAFEALNLTDAQKQRMKEIEKEFTPEFEKTLEQYAQAHVILTNKFLAACDKQSSNASNTLESIKAKLAAEDPEYKKIQDETIAKTQAFTLQFKTKVFDVLTDEQWKQLQALIDNPSEPAKIFREQLKEHRDERKRATLWLPDADLWKPGMAIPDEYRKKRSSRK